MTLYAWDPNDPVLQTWTQGVPGHRAVDREDIRDELLPHLRYPEDLFKVQRELLSRYHVTDPQAFYNGQDFWKIPDDPTTHCGRPGPAAVLPDAADARQDEAPFSLTTTFAPTARPQLAAFMAVNADPTRGRTTARSGCCACRATRPCRVPARCRTTSSPTRTSRHS